MISSLISLIIFIVVVGIVLWLLRYLINTIPMEEQFRRVANVAIMIVGVLIIILILLDFIGMIDGGMPRLRSRGGL